MLTASAFLSPAAIALANDNHSSKPSPIRLGIASYTFRNFDADHLIGFMKELNTPYLNLKDVHLPMTPADQVAPRARSSEMRALS